MIYQIYLDTGVQYSLLAYALSACQTHDAWPALQHMQQVLPLFQTHADPENECLQSFARIAAKVVTSVFGGHVSLPEMHGMLFNWDNGMNSMQCNWSNGVMADQMHRLHVLNLISVLCLVWYQRSPNVS